MGVKGRKGSKISKTGDIIYGWPLSTIIFPIFPQQGFIELRSSTTTISVYKCYCYYKDIFQPNKMVQAVQRVQIAVCFFWQFGKNNWTVAGQSCAY